MTRSSLVTSAATLLQMRSHPKGLGSLSLFGHRLGASTTNIYFSQFRRLEVQAQGTKRCGVW